MLQRHRRLSLFSGTKTSRFLAGFLTRSLKKSFSQKIVELEAAHLEKVSQLYRLAEFGRLAAGLFHDMVNPLTGLSLHLNAIRDSIHPHVSEVKENLRRALKASESLEHLIATVTKQLKPDAPNSRFSPAENIKEVLLLFSHRLKLLEVTVVCYTPNTISLHGDYLKFQQILTNLLSNALDSYETVIAVRPRKIIIKLWEASEIIYLTVKDNGSGIEEITLPHIFDPFFSTKPSTKGMGLGLAMVQYIITHSFQGTITVKSMRGRGTIFTLSLSKN